ncbi:MAG: P-II family nitrogen regulator [Acidaminococcaceae bacterium]|nr:P-II family nitrogen regulator [Acidaminococcaceae bacterium]MBQ6744039.1 P-II family nitrogen regulator [Acidaminococcaceae bacterium]MBQ6779136.1 P-II family nitrogen regulator [Acidaminococcaceae bacterium]MBQ8700986.1 P-II family nitrogen regulator [Acidaminococcaceae bacterium]MBR4526435.1 P-II family nitrogen regulator [Acidaminococcaceae bacterium]
MSELYFMMTITSRDMLPKFLEAFDKNNLPIGFVSLGYGTAKDDILDMLGLVRSEKAVGMTVVTGAGWEEAKWYLRKKMYIDVPDTGISFIIPMSSIGGKRELAFLTAGQNYRKGEESVMKDTTMELLVVVSNQGHNDLVMDAARGAGAYGGTVIHARGTGMNQAELFFGVSLASEKDLTFIVTKKNQRNAIMSAIMKEAGMETPAQSIVFSLPVTDAVGLNTGDEDTK